jgi:hypothetical protein
MNWTVNNITKIIKPDFYLLKSHEQRYTDYGLKC